MADAEPVVVLNPGSPQEPDAQPVPAAEPGASGPGPAGGSATPGRVTRAVSSRVVSGLDVEPRGTFGAEVSEERVAGRASISTEQSATQTSRPDPPVLRRMPDRMLLAELMRRAGESEHLLADLSTQSDEEIGERLARILASLAPAASRPSGSSEDARGEQRDTKTTIDRPATGREHGSERDGAGLQDGEGPAPTPDSDRRPNAPADVPGPRRGHPPLVPLLVRPPEANLEPRPVPAANRAGTDPQSVADPGPGTGPGAGSDPAREPERGPGFESGVDEGAEPEPGVASVPERLAGGSLSAADVVRSLGADDGDEALVDEVGRQISPVVGARAWEALRAQVLGHLLLSQLKAKLSGLSRGDKLHVPVNAGGWHGELVVTGGVGGARALRLGETMEFEHGADSSASSGRSRGTAWHRSLGLVGRAFSDGGSATVSGTAAHEAGRLESVANIGRAFTRGKTEEAALWVEASARFAVDFPGLRESGEAEPLGTGVARFEAPALIAVPWADSPDAPPPGWALLPPARIRELRGLGGTDIVRDLYAVDGSGRRSNGGLEELLRVPAGRTRPSPAQAGRAAFGDEWAAVRAELLRKVSLTIVHERFKDMSAWEPLEIELEAAAGRVRISADIARMRYLRDTSSTEFYGGTDRSWTISARDTVRRFGEVVGTGYGEGSAAVFDRAGLTATRYSGADAASVNSLTVLTSNGTKTKVPGSIFDGLAELEFLFSPENGEAKPGSGAIGFQVLIEKAETTPAATADRKVLRLKRGAAASPRVFKAPTLMPGSVGEQTVYWAPPPTVFDSGPAGGLPESTVVYDVYLAGDMHTGAGASSVPSALDAGGSRRFGRGWQRYQRLVHKGYGRGRIASSLVGMTRGRPVRSPALGATKTRITALAKVKELTYVRAIDEAELNAVNEVTTLRERRGVVWRQISGSASGSGGHTADGTSWGGGFGVGRQRRGRRVWLAGRGGKRMANAKYPKPMAVYFGTAEVPITFGGRGRNALRQTATVKFLVAVPQSEATRVVVDAPTTPVFRAPEPPERSEPPEISERGAAAPEAREVGAAAGGPAFLPPRRITRDHRLAFDDVVIRFLEPPDLLARVERSVAKGFGAWWPRVREELAEKLDLAEIRPLTNDLTNGKPWSHTVKAGGRTLTVELGARVKGATARESVGKFEFEHGNEQYAVVGQGEQMRTTTSTTATELLRVPHTEVRYTDTHSRGQEVRFAQESMSRGVAKGKTIEPAGLLDVELEYPLLIKQSVLLGLPIPDELILVAARTEVAVPLRDTVAPDPQPAEPGDSAGQGTPPEPERQHYAVLQRIVNSRALGSDDIVTDVSPVQAPTDAAASAAVHATKTWRSLLRRFWRLGAKEEQLPPPAIMSVLDQLDAQGIRALTTAARWQRVKASLAGQLDFTLLQQQMRPMMAGQPLVLHAAGATVTVTASVHQLRYEGDAGTTEFNVGTNRAVITETTDGVFTKSSIRSQSQAVRVTGTSNPLPHGVEAVAGFAAASQAGRRDSTALGEGLTAGEATKSKAPSSAYAGTAMLHFVIEDDAIAFLAKAHEAYSGVGLVYDRMRLSRTKKAIKSLDLRRAALADAPGASAQAPGPAGSEATADGEGEASGRTAGQADRDPIEQEIQRLIERRSTLVDRIGRRSRRRTGKHAANAKVSLSAIVETGDAVQVETAEQAVLPEPSSSGRVVQPPELPRDELRRPQDEVWDNGDFVVRDISDVKSLNTLLGTVGTYVYGRDWHSTVRGGRARDGITTDNARMTRDSLTREHLMAWLPHLTAGGQMTSTPFGAEGRESFVKVRARVVRLIFERLDKTSTDAPMSEAVESGLLTQDRFDGWSLNLLGGVRGDAAVAAEIHGSGGLGRRARVSIDSARGGRVINNAKIPAPAALYEAAILFEFDFHRRGELVRSESGIVPASLSVAVDRTDPVTRPSDPELLKTAHHFAPVAAESPAQPIDPEPEPAAGDRGEVDIRSGIWGLENLAGLETVFATRGEFSTAFQRTAGAPPSAPDSAIADVRQRFEPGSVHFVDLILDEQSMPVVFGRGGQVRPTPGELMLLSFLIRFPDKAPLVIAVPAAEPSPQLMRYFAQLANSWNQPVHVVASAGSGGPLRVPSEALVDHVEVLGPAGGRVVEENGVATFPAGSILRFPQAEDSGGVRPVMTGLVSYRRDETAHLVEPDARLLSALSGRYPAGGGVPNSGSGPKVPASVVVDHLQAWWSSTAVVRPVTAKTLAEVEGRVAARVERGQPPVPFTERSATAGLADPERGGLKFGVEIEFEFPQEWSDKRKAKARSAILAKLRAAKLTRETKVLAHFTLSGREQYPESADGWAMELDDTVSGGEVISGKLRDDAGAWRSLQTVLRIIREHGGEITPNAGGHIHVDLSQYGTDLKVHQTLLALFRAFQPELFHLAMNPEADKHRGTGQSSPFDARTAAFDRPGFASLREHFAHLPRSAALNFRGVHGTGEDHVEFRLFDGSLDEGVIQARIKIALGLVYAALRLARQPGWVPPAPRGIDLDTPGETRVRRPAGAGGVAVFEHRPQDVGHMLDLLNMIFWSPFDRELGLALAAITHWFGEIADPGQPAGSLLRRTPHEPESSPAGPGSAVPSVSRSGSVVSGDGESAPPTAAEARVEEAAQRVRDWLEPGDPFVLRPGDFAGWDEESYASGADGSGPLDVLLEQSGYAPDRPLVIAVRSGKLDPNVLDWASARADRLGRPVYLTEESGTGYLRLDYTVAAAPDVRVYAPPDSTFVDTEDDVVAPDGSVLVVLPRGGSAGEVLGLISALELYTPEFGGQLPVSGDGARNQLLRAVIATAPDVVRDRLEQAGLLEGPQGAELGSWLSDANTVRSPGADRQLFDRVADALLVLMRRHLNELHVDEQELEYDEEIEIRFLRQHMALGAADENRSPALTDDEFNRLSSALGSWSGSGPVEYGRALPELLAFAMDFALNIVQAGSHRVLEHYGRAILPVVSVYSTAQGDRQGDAASHYAGFARPVPEADGDELSSNADSRADSEPVSETGADAGPADVSAVAAAARDLFEPAVEEPGRIGGIDGVLAAVPRLPLPFQPLWTDIRFDVDQVTREAGGDLVHQLDELRGVTRPPDDQTIERIGRLMAGPIKTRLDNSRGHTRVIFQLPTDNLALSAMRLAKVVANTLGQRVLLSIGDTVFAELCPPGEM